MITVEWEHQQWDDNTAPWEYGTKTHGDPLTALQDMGSVVFYENTRPVAWSASTAEEAEYVRTALARRTYMSGWKER